MIQPIRHSDWLVCGRFTELKGTRMADDYKRVGHLKTIDDFKSYLSTLDLELPIEENVESAEQGSPLAQPIQVGDVTVGNRWAIHPMEGWDAEPDGRPTENVIRRWRNFGLSGAKLIWGGEAFAVQHDGRANPNQLYYRPENEAPVAGLLKTLTDAHQERFGNTDDLLVGLQLTHSGRFSRPNRKDRLEPRIAYHHPTLDAKFNIDPDDDAVVFTDDDIKRLIEKYVCSAKMAAAIGFRFVDVKHCHGYLGHEFLSAYTRPGPYGGSFENRTRFMREIVEGIRAECPDLMIGVRLSAFDMPPFHPDPDRSKNGKLGPGIPDDHPDSDYPGFGCERDSPLTQKLDETIQLLTMMRDDLKINIVNLSAGSPYYNPHIQRPAFFPPSDGYQPPEDPLVGCVRQIQTVRRLHEAVQGLPMVGSAFSYFQDWIPNIAQALVRDSWVDFVGLGRMVLSYPDLPADVLEGTDVETKKICRTFSDCTTAPRNGIISGCYPLDDHYKRAPEHNDLKAAKKALREKLKAMTA